MRTAAPALLRAGLLAGPTVLAFFSGGYFPTPQLWALIAAWAMLAIAALAVPGSIVPRAAATRLALAGLGAYAAWAWIASSAAPQHGPARQTVQLGLLYLALLAAGTLAWRSRRAARLVEPGLALGGLVVIGYGLSARLLPGIVEVSASQRAGGRLEQPLTYWNAMGALAAVALVLCARLAGDATRPRPLRLTAAAAAVPLGAGVYLSFSRGAIVAAIAGLAVLALLARDRAQVRASVAAGVFGVVGATATAPFGAVRALEGGDRAGQGVAALVLLAAAAGLAAAVAAWLSRRPERGRPAPAWLRPAAAAATVAIALAPYVVAVADGGGEREARFGATTSRLSDVGSHRGDYWAVALDVVAEHPLLGAGTGSFGVEWLQRRPIDERVIDAHSLYLETAAELGLLGLLALLAAFAGVVAAARAVLRTDAALAVGPAAAVCAWAIHAGLDWDWEMPALTAVAVVLAGLLLGARERAARPRDGYAA
jgi:hypothetical protein